MEEYIVSYTNTIVGTS